MKKAIFFLIYFLSPLVVIGLVYSTNPTYYGGSGFIPLILGATAFTWLNAQLIISARPRWLESTFGLDRIFIFHSIMPVIALVGAFVHKLLKESVYGESFKTQLGDIALIIFISATVLALIFLIDTIVKLIKPIGYLRKIIRKILPGRYSVQKILHNANVVAVVIIFVHVLLSRSAQTPRVLAVYILYFGLAMGFYLYHKIVRPYFIAQKYTVDQVVVESDSISTLILRPVKGSVFSYLPGQLGYIRIFGQEITTEEHPFSYSSQPENKEFLTMTIKRLGDWTSTINKVQPGDRAIVDGPYGNFSPLLNETDKGIVLIAGGVGITPMLSILRYYREKNKDKRILLFWGIRNKQDFILSGELSACDKDMRNFIFIPVVEHLPEMDQSLFPVIETGYVNGNIIQKYLELAGCQMNDSHFYICGPAIMRTKVIKDIKNKGALKKNIHYENFTL